jgi:hypothetical protein
VDLPSRGVITLTLTLASDLVGDKLLLDWEGPEFLLQDKSTWLENKVEEGAEAVKEAKTSEIGMFITEANLSDTRLDPVRHSNWRRLARLHAWTQRFVENCTL